MNISRRSLLKLGALGAVTGTGSSLFGAGVAHAAEASPPVSSLNELAYRLVVPEIFRALPSAPSHSEALVIGTGFGAAVAALRLGQAGVQVTMLERGSRWPRDPWRQSFSSESLLDGRAVWFRKSFTGFDGITRPVDSFGGVLDVTDYEHIKVWRGAAVGGGSVVFTGAMVQPEQRFFDQVFQGVVSYEEMDRRYYPLARQMLGVSPMPSDVYQSAPFGHSRLWDTHVTQAGYTPQRIDSIFQWEVVRSELTGRSRPSAIIGESTFGNANGAKYDLGQNYLPQAEATGRVSIHPGHRVTAIGREVDGRYWVQVDVIAPNGTVLRKRTLTADRLFLGAGSIGTSELLVAARDTGALPDLDESIGAGWGSNGDAAIARSFSSLEGFNQGSPCASRILDEGGMPVTLENWYVPNLPANPGLIGTLGMALDSQRGSFRYDSTRQKVVLDWPSQGNDNAVAALRVVNNRIAAASGTQVGVPILAPDVNASFTAHPLGGAVLGAATDACGRVKGYTHLYVVDGAAVPGSTGTVNPSLTITALAERSMAEIIRAGQ
ncbi:GMC oxidoreductase [Pyxidicoccus sp. MSG2]|uniref:GMC oxidoreductase n=1 Tax=Pyxidicoccus sp. MSG2 TaxID=2996790 RepID=UPI002271616C|nr:GMC oxidoreductase [Pyxidicoccus sp. MSG2]MCY1015772.1 GMC oxidoreductase [Pyxidicoccus sp. MSG2]